MIRTLQKPVCRQCINEETPWTWSEKDEKRWKNGKVCCPYHSIIPIQDALTTCKHSGAHQGALYIYEERKL
jgi:hypothetical protein